MLLAWSTTRSQSIDDFILEQMQQQHIRALPPLL
jgi:hypothetical protein